MDIRFWYLDVGYWIWVCVYGFQIWILDILDMGIWFMRIGYGYCVLVFGCGLFDMRMHL